MSSPIPVRADGPPLLGARLAGRFELISLAGAGGLGTVYRAREIASERVVAVKVLNGKGESEARFAREAAVLSSLHHPGVVKYLDFGMAEGARPFLVMEWLVGEDLDERLSRGPLDVADSLILVRAVAEALAAAHRQGIVHRDLKPANLFLVDGNFSAVKIVDFGLALPKVDDGMTAPGILLGTPAYMAPEQVRGERVDARADIFALGAVLFRCLVGQSPFSGDNQLAVLAKILVEEAADLGAVCPSVPPELAALVARMLAKDAAERPSDGAALITALEQLRAEGDAAPRLLSAVSAIEQRVACIVLSGGAAHRADVETRHRAGSHDVTLPSEPSGVAPPRQMAPSRHHALREAVDDIGGKLDVLADGTRLVTFPAASPAEQAGLAARCALAFAALRPNACHVIATGRVVVAGSLQVGEVIDRAATALLALQAAGAPGAGVRLDERTVHLLDDRFDVQGSGEWRELSGMRAGPAGARTVLGRAMPCVGRERELASLTASLDDSIDERRARAVLIVAAPGMGKSRLLNEFLRTTVAPRTGIEVLQARGEVSRAGSPFALAAQLLAAAAGMSANDGPAKRYASLVAMIAVDFTGDRARHLTEFLGEICGARTPHESASEALHAARVESTVMTDSLREAWTDWLRARSARAPALLVLEDLHWGDRPSLHLIDAARDGLADSALLVIATARPEARVTFAELWSRRPMEEIQLGPLPRRAAEQIANEALGGSVDPDLLRTLVERGAGNPFHLEEIVRAVAAGHRPDVMPDSVLGMVQARVDLLDGDARRMLRAGSVFGESFWPGAVSALLGGNASAAVVSARLARLIAEEVLIRRRTSRISGEAEYAFRHAIVRDAAYSMLPEKDRAHAHRLAGEWLERAGETDPAVLAEHYERGGALAQAAVFLQRAAVQALDGNDLARAMECADRAIACTPDTGSLGAIRAIQSEVAFWRGDLERAASWALEAADCLASGSAAWFAAVSLALGAFGQRGQNDLVATWLDRAAFAGSPPDARGAQVTTLCRGLTQLYWAHHASELRDAHARLYELAQPFETLGAYETGWVHRVQAEGLWLRTCDIDRGLAEFDASCEAYERAGARRALCLTRINSASLYGWSGEIDRSAEILSRAHAEAGRLRSDFLVRYGIAVRGLTEAWAGAPGAEAHMREVLPAFGSSPRLAYVARVVIAHIAFERGDVDVAEEHATAALAIPVVADLKPAAMAVLSRVLVAKRSVAQAVETAREAVRIEHAARDTELTEGMPDLALAQALEAQGDHAGAVDALRAGYDRLGAIAARIATPERRRLFWARKLSNDGILALAIAWGIADATV